MACLKEQVENKCTLIKKKSHRSQINPEDIIFNIAFSTQLSCLSGDSILDRLIS